MKPLTGRPGGPTAATMIVCGLRCKQEKQGLSHQNGFTLVGSGRDMPLPYIDGPVHPNFQQLGDTMMYVHRR
jgi:hypothetical protein